MIYRFGISTAANTLETAKKKTVLKLCSGVIHQIDILFPPGSAGLLHVHINRALHQLWPTNSDQSFAADGDKISFREHYELTSVPYQLQAWTWNDDDTYAHDVIIRIGILPRKDVLRRLF